MTFVSDKVTCRPLQPMLSAGSEQRLEHQGQTSISDPDKNLGLTCIFISGMKEVSVQPDLCWNLSKTGKTSYHKVYVVLES